VVDSPEELLLKWELVIAGKPDFVKIFLTDSERRNERLRAATPEASPGLDPALVPEIVRLAHAAGLRVSAHVETAHDFRVALAAGVDEMAHMPGGWFDAGDDRRRYELSRRDARLAARRGVVVIPTIAADDDPRLRPAQVRNLARLKRYGVTLAVGADSYGQTSRVAAHGLAATGLFTNLELLNIWSYDTPRTIFPGRRIGRLTPGYEASFLVLQDDPLVSFDATKTILFRFKGGAPIDLGEPSAVTAFIDVNVVDVRRGSILPRQSVIVRDQRIVSIGGAVPAQARQIDGRGKYLLPGLWDMHFHTLMGTTTGVDALKLAVESYFPLLLAHGVTGVRDMGSMLEPIIALRDEIARGAVVGPRLIVAGASLTGPSPFGGGSAHTITVRNEEEARAAVARLQDAGVDFIKVHDFLGRAITLTIAGEARRRSMPVAGHQRPALDPADAAEAGQISIDHVPPELVAYLAPDGGDRATAFYQAWFRGGMKSYLQGLADLWESRSTEMTASMMRRLRDAGAMIVPTIGLRLDPVDHGELQPASVNPCSAIIAEWNAIAVSERERVRRATAELLQAAHRNGIPILPGSDGPGGCLAPGLALHDELVRITEAGIPTRDVLRGATLDAARLAGAHDSGAVEEGNAADLVLLAANPLDEIRNVAKIEGVMHRGRWLSRQTLDAMIDGVRAGRR
jgi:imidazolonepropionase-like amidohydrolase